MTTLAVIPCRARSQRIPFKNTRLLGGKPLFQWTVDAAKAASTIDTIVVSTEDPLIAEMAKHMGVEVRDRPPELAADDVQAVDVVLDVLNCGLWRCDLVVMLQPTSPFRRAMQIDTAVSLAMECEWPVVSVSENRSIPYSEVGAEVRFPRCSNGVVYVAYADYLRRKGGFHARHVTTYLLPDDISGHDINTELDWHIAEMIVEKGLV